MYLCQYSSAAYMYYGNIQVRYQFAIKDAYGVNEICKMFELQQISQTNTWPPKFQIISNQVCPSCICSYFSPKSCSQFCHLSLLGICPRRPGAHLGYCCSGRPTYTYLNFLVLSITFSHRRRSLTPWGMSWALGEAVKSFENKTMKEKSVNSSYNVL